MVEIEILRKGQAVSSNGTEVDLNDELLDQVVESYDPQNFKAPLIVSHDTAGSDDASLAAANHPQTLSGIETGRDCAKR